jgi:tetratricopeptide (TPR) repeat protein
MSKAAASAPAGPPAAGGGGGPQPLNPALVDELIAKGSEFAVMIKEAMIQFIAGLQILGQNALLPDQEYDRMIVAFAEAIQIQEFVCTFPQPALPKLFQCLERIITRFGDKADKVDESARILYLFLKNLQNDVLAESLAKYPESNWLRKAAGCVKCAKQQFLESVDDFDAVLKSNPKDIETLYNKATALKFANKIDEAIEAFELFIKISPKDHRKIPEAHYAIGLTDAQKIIGPVKPNTPIAEPRKVFDALKKKYLDGLEAEKLQLPFFMPYKSPPKQMLEQQMDALFKMCKNQGDTTIELPEFKRVFMPLQDAFRVKAVRSHRANFKRWMESGKVQKKVVEPSEAKPTPIEGKTAIVLIQMDQKNDSNYDEKFLPCCIIESPILQDGILDFVVEDPNRHVVSVLVDEVSEEDAKKFKVGCTALLVSPKLTKRVQSDGVMPVIRISSPNSVLFGQPKKSPCSFCGAENAAKKCSKCHVAKYCSKECQELDWKHLQHFNTCFVTDSSGPDEDDESSSSTITNADGSVETKDTSEMVGAKKKDDDIPDVPYTQEFLQQIEETEKSSKTRTFVKYGCAIFILILVLWRVILFAMAAGSKVSVVPVDE